ncbi:hypothetical protein HQ590_11065 [bacterium]|nr:hypothetical protein [bacterium]
MNSDPNQDLDDLLRQARPPERPAEYWDEFPRRVIARLREAAPARPAVASWTWDWRWAAGLATACLVIGIGLGIWFRSRRPAEPDYAKLYTEVEALFPNQVRAIVADDQGVRLVLSDRPTVPSTAPLLVRLCRRTGCQNVISFSGQQVRLNGQTIELLADGRGNVLVVSPQFVWSSADPGQPTTGLRVSAERLAL